MVAIFQESTTRTRTIESGVPKLVQLICFHFPAMSVHLFFWGMLALLDLLQCRFRCCCDSKDCLCFTDLADCCTKRSSLLPERDAAGFSLLHLLAVKPAWSFGDMFEHPLFTLTQITFLGLGAMHRSMPTTSLIAVALDHDLDFLPSWKHDDAGPCFEPMRLPNLDIDTESLPARMATSGHA